MRSVLIAGALLTCLWNAGARADWPTLAGVPPLQIILHEPNERTPGDGRLPSAQLHGPQGFTDIPTGDRRAHRPSGRATKRFPRPAVSGLRLSWCSAPGIDCGPIAAQHFCQAAGYRRVIEAVQERDVGLYAETRQIGSGLVCAGRGCDGFLSITCTRS